MKYLPLLLCLALLPVIAASAPLAADAPPLTPTDFHEQEAQRLLRGFEHAPPSPLLELQSDFDVAYYDLNLDVRDFYGQTISGAVTTLGRALIDDFDEVILDLCTSLTVDSVISEGVALGFTHASNRLTITLHRTYAADELFSVTVHYHGTPCRTSSWTSFDYWDRPTPAGDIPSIATLSEPYGARDWWPSKNIPSDKADSARIAITVADTLIATSNGILESITPVAPASHTYHWFEKHPISSYLICLSATNYAEWSDWYHAPDGDSIPIINYTYPEKLAHSQVSWSILPEVLGFLEATFGEFPFRDEKYGHTMFNFSGAMEHQCNTSYGRSITTGTHAYDWIVVHEAAHQYFGDDVTLHDWQDIWLNEGFASYGEALWVEQTQGAAAFQNYLFGGLNVTDPSGPVYNFPQLFDGNTVYNKGAWVLHTLRGVLRDDSLFFAVLREYRSRHAYGNATTADFLNDASDVTGFDVTPYLYNWLYKTNRPRYEIAFGSGPIDGMVRTAVRIRQTQTNPDTTFRARLDLAFSGAQDTSLTIENFTWDSTYFFDLGYAPSTLTLDPGNWLLRQVTTASLPPLILNHSLNDALETESYADTLVAVGGTAPYSWNLLSGTLPGGIELTSEGILSGTPVEAGDFPIAIKVTDQLADTSAREFVLHVAGFPRVPEDLTCSLTAPDSLTLRWLPADFATEYEIYRRSVSGPFELIATVSDTFFTERILGEEGTRIYRLRSRR